MGLSKSYYKKHKYCPKCGNDGDNCEQTCMPTFLEIDTNNVSCKCGWEGIVDNLIKKQINRGYYE